MMGVYIKGMRMPKGCYDPTVAPSYCFLLRSGTCGFCHEYADEHNGELCMEYPQGCPLVEVKEPHGRLINADKLLKWLLDEWKLDIDYDGMINEVCEDAIDAIQNAPTVIEAEDK